MTNFTVLLIIILLSFSSMLMVKDLEQRVNDLEINNEDLYLE